jgi:hypothetical protein
MTTENQAEHPPFLRSPNHSGLSRPRNISLLLSSALSLTGRNPCQAIPLANQRRAYEIGGSRSVNQAELRQMAEERIKDAKALLKGKRWEFAYYTAGYAIECALKSCLLARMTLTGWVFNEEVKRVDACRTHNFMELIDIAGMRHELHNKFEESRAAGSGFLANWNIVETWKVTSRYEAKTETEARALFAAITDKPHGVMIWIRTYW